MNWLKRLWCRHLNIEARTFLSYDSGPMVRRVVKCTDCGAGLPMEMRLSSERIMTLLAQAEKLAPDETIEV